METAILLLIRVSAALGWVLGRLISQRVKRVIVLLGIITLFTAVIVIALAIARRSPVTTWTSGLIAVVLLVLSAVSLPFGVAAVWRR